MKNNRLRTRFDSFQELQCKTLYSLSFPWKYAPSDTGVP
jgi:hypothetical protein